MGSGSTSWQGYAREALARHGRLLSAALLYAQAGCAWFDHDFALQRYRRLDRGDRTVAVPAAARGLAGSIKDALAQNGWRLVIYSLSGEPITASVEPFDSRSAKTARPKFRLAVSAYQFDSCWNGDPKYNFDISLIDTGVGAEAISMRGGGCESDVVARFVEVLKEEHE